LIIPIATTSFISLIIKRPRGAWFAKVSTQTGLLGLSLIKAHSPFLMNEGFSSIEAPVFLSIFLIISSNSHETNA